MNSFASPVSRASVQSRRAELRAESSSSRRRSRIWNAAGVTAVVGFAGDFVSDLNHTMQGTAELVSSQTGSLGLLAVATVAALAKGAHHASAAETAHIAALRASDEQVLPVLDPHASRLPVLVGEQFWDPAMLDTREPRQN